MVLTTEIQENKIHLSAIYALDCTVGHKSYDFCFHKKYMEAGVMPFYGSLYGGNLCLRVEVDVYSIDTLSKRFVAKEC